MKWKKKVIYVSSPHTKDAEIMKRLSACCRFLIELNFVPVSPCLLYSKCLDLDCSVESCTVLNCGQRLLEMCDELWYFNFETKSFTGNDITLEIAAAKRLNIPIVSGLHYLETYEAELRPKYEKWRSKEQDARQILSIIDKCIEDPKDDNT